MEDIIKKIEEYRDTNDACFKLANRLSTTEDKRTDFDKVMDFAFLIGQMNGQLDLIKTDLQTLKEIENEHI
jgi:hypothetical protein